MSTLWVIDPAAWSFLGALGGALKAIPAADISKGDVLALTDDYLPDHREWTVTSESNVPVGRLKGLPAGSAGSLSGSVALRLAATNLQEVATGIDGSALVPAGGFAYIAVAGWMPSTPVSMAAALKDMDVGAGPFTQAKAQAWRASAVSPAMHGHYIELSPTNAKFSLYVTAENFMTAGHWSSPNNSAPKATFGIPTTTMVTLLYFTATPSTKPARKILNGFVPGDLYVCTNPAAYTDLKTGWTKRTPPTSQFYSDADVIHYGRTSADGTNWAWRGESKIFDGSSWVDLL